ncbi:hypothetical protein F5B20DRAFT_562349 [Whalleya microplaca]|nr:hypothetical protein F5B20DRAFT_562349 [Whalleya microplaca]
MLTGRTDTCRFPGNILLEQEGVDYVFSLQYGLSGYDDANPFPARYIARLFCNLHVSS